MMRPLRVCFIVLSLYAPSLAQQALVAKDIPLDLKATSQARQFQQVKVNKSQVHQQVSKLKSELTWHKRLDDAVRAAQKSGKPILWIHALGDLTGYV